MGRDRDLERLGQLWKEVASGDRGVALLAGEPGVGKTRLAAELARRVYDEGATVLGGRCDEDLGVPYQPFVEALRHFIEHSPAEEVATGLGRHAGELVRLVPEIGQQVSELPPPLRSDPETERYRLFDAVAAWLAAASADRAVLLVVDDLQWATKPTLLLLRHVVRSPEARRLLVLGIYRATELGHDHPLIDGLADLRRQGGVERLSLAGLDSSGVAAFMEQAAGHALDDEDLVLARTIHTETEGNPFFVREILRHLTETGAVQRRDGHWATRLPVEQSVSPKGYGTWWEGDSPVSRRKRTASSGRRRWSGLNSSCPSSWRRRSWTRKTSSPPSKRRRRRAWSWRCPGRPAATGSPTLWCATPATARSPPPDG